MKSRTIKIDWRELLEGALATAELPSNPYVEPEPMEKLALVCEALAELIEEHGPGVALARASNDVRTAALRLWTIQQAMRPALVPPVLVRRADLREEAGHE